MVPMSMLAPRVEELAGSCHPEAIVLSARGSFFNVTDLRGVLSVSTIGVTSCGQVDDHSRPDGYLGGCADSKDPATSTTGAAWVCRPPYPSKAASSTRGQFDATGDAGLPRACRRDDGCVR